MPTDSSIGNHKESPHKEEYKNESFADAEELIATSTAYLFQGRLDEALKMAKEALRVDPNSSKASLLIGNIYEQMDNYDSALLFYRFALELDPSYTEAILKLKNLEDSRKEVSILPSYGVKSNISDQITGTRLILAAGVLLLILIVVMIPLLAMKRMRAANEANNGSSSVISQNLGTEQQNRNVLQYPSEPSTRPVAPQQGSAPTSDHGSASKTERTPAESLILKRISENEDVKKSGVKVNEVIADPRNNNITVSSSILYSQYLTKSELIKYAYMLAESAFLSHRDVKTVTTRIVLESDTTTPMIGFMGDLSRATYDMIPNNASTDQLLTAFTNQWWNPHILDK